MNSNSRAGTVSLPALPYAEWRATKDTLHLWAQVVGKIKLATTAPRNHWWNVPLYLDPRGLTTRRLRFGDIGFAIDFDFIDHQLVVRSNRKAPDSFSLHDGLSVSDFYRQIDEVLGRAGIEVTIDARPFGIPITTPFADDHEHDSYLREYVESFWRVLAWVDTVFEDFSSWFCGKASPVHLFWHSFDLAVTRFSGRKAPEPSEADPVTREAYSAELISFGFWPGDPNTEDASFYSYTHPEPGVCESIDCTPGPRTGLSVRTARSPSWPTMPSGRATSLERTCSGSSKVPTAPVRAQRDGTPPSSRRLSVRASIGSMSSISTAKGCPMERLHQQRGPHSLSVTVKTS